MAITLKTAEQIDKMRRAGRIVRRVLDRMGEMLAPGVTTEELDAEARRICAAAGGTCLFNGVPGRGGAGPFPGNICASINEEVVHGIPSSRAVRAGDVIGIDFGVKLDGWCGDAAETFIVGEVAPRVARLVSVTRNALAMVVEMIRPKQKWSVVAGAMQSYIESEGFAIVREFVGHGIGSEMWEEPKVPNFVSPELVTRDIELREGMTFAVEPMVNLGSAAVEYAPDGWTVRTRDRLPSAHFEHTLAVSADGVDVLTQ